MQVTGGCYCKKIRYESTGDPIARMQCHCRECQYITGGGPNMFMVVPEDGFTFIEGSPKGFSRSDLEAPVTREFCPDCGTHLLTRSPKRPGAIILKVGTMDDPTQYGGPQMAIFTCDQQAFHEIPEGVQTFERRP